MSNGVVENAAREVGLVGVGDNDFDGVVLELLSIVDRDGVGDLNLDPPAGI
jgi:hypothetical protein